MKNVKIQLLSLFVLPLTFITMQPVEPKEQITEPMVEVAPAPTAVILKYSLEYGIDYNLLYSTLLCESSLNPQVKSGDSGQSHGIAQIKTKTWEFLEKKLGEDLDDKSYYDAIKLTAFAFSVNEGDNWTAYRAIKNGGSYTFFNRHTQEWQTVYCKYRKML